MYLSYHWTGFCEHADNPIYHPSNSVCCNDFIYNSCVSIYYIDPTIRMIVSFDILHRSYYPNGRIYYIDPTIRMIISLCRSIELWTDLVYSRSNHWTGWMVLISLATMMKDCIDGSNLCIASTRHLSQVH